MPVGIVYVQVRCVDRKQRPRLVPMVSAPDAALPADRYEPTIIKPCSYPIDASGVAVFANATVCVERKKCIDIVLEGKPFFQVCDAHRHR